MKQANNVIGTCPCQRFNSITKQYYQHCCTLLAEQKLQTPPSVRKLLHSVIRY